MAEATAEELHFLNLVRFLFASTPPTIGFEANRTLSVVLGKREVGSQAPCFALRTDADEPEDGVPNVE